MAEFENLECGLACKDAGADGLFALGYGGGFLQDLLRDGVRNDGDLDGRRLQEAGERL